MSDRYPFPDPSNPICPVCHETFTHTHIYQKAMLEDGQPYPGIYFHHAFKVRGVFLTGCFVPLERFEGGLYEVIQAEKLEADRRSNPTLETIFNRAQDNMRRLPRRRSRRL